ncbi:unnamed protein product [Rhodiola kirilowii]
MGSSEPSLVPEWLKSNASATGSGRTSQLSTSSTSHTDSASLANYSRNKSFRSIGESDSPRTLLDRSPSSNSRSFGISNISPKNPYSSFSRSRRDREKEKPAFGELWERDCFDPVGKNTFRHSHLLVSRKQEVLVPQRVASEFTNNDKNYQSYRNGFHDDDCISKSIKKSEFDKDFPMLPVDEKQGVPDIARVASPILTVAAPGLPIGSSALVGEGWSALADVPSVVEASCVGSPRVHQPPETSISPDSELNMAEALAQSPRVAPQVSAEAQKLEQMAIKQYRQLIPMTPGMPKSMVLNCADKSMAKTAVRSDESNHTSKIGLQSHVLASSQLFSQSPRGAHIIPESVKTSQVGKFHVLKPPWENTISPVLKDDFALAHDVGNQSVDTLALQASAALSRNSNRSGAANTERKAAASSLNAPSIDEKKRMLSHARSRNEFFNSVRKKASMTDSACSEATSTSIGQSSEVIRETTLAKVSSNGVDNGHSNCNGGLHEEELKFSIKENNSVSTVEIISDEEEAAFLRSLGWEENGSEDDGLTEEEINTFYQEVLKLGPTLR